MTHRFKSTKWATGRGIEMLPLDKVQQRFCTSCGARLPTDANFCGACGVRRAELDANLGPSATPPVLEPDGSPALSGPPQRDASPYTRLTAGVWVLAAALALIMFSMGMFDEPLRWVMSKIPNSSTLRSSAKLAVVKERFPPTEYPPQPASFGLEIKSLADQTITVTDIVVNNRRECQGLVFASLPQKLSTGDTIKVVPLCDPVKVVIATNRGEQVYTWDE